MKHVMRWFFALAVLWLGAATAGAQGVQVAQPSLSLVVVAGFNHANLEVGLSSTTPGFNFKTLKVTSDSSWVTPTIDGTTPAVALAFNTSALVSSNNLATITITGGGGSTTISIHETTEVLNIVAFKNDPVRSRTYGIQEDGTGQGALVAIDPLTNTNIACVSLGDKPADLAVSSDGSEILAINSADGSISVINAATLVVTQTIDLTDYTNWGAASTGAHVAYGAGNVIYYTDGNWAPILYVYNRATAQVLQEVQDNSYGIGDFALNPAGTMLYGWIQYGWSAGWAGSYLVQYSVNADGTLTFVERTNPNYPTVLSRDPVDTPLLINDSGASVFAKQLEVSGSSVTTTENSFPGGIYAITPGGELAATNSTIYSASSGLALYSLPVTTDVQTITPDYSRLVYFDPGTATIGTINLIQAIGPTAMGIVLSPSNGSICLAPSALQWQPVPGIGEYEVYLGQSESAVATGGTTASTYLGETNGPEIALTQSLTPGVTYYWRVDEVSASDGVIQGQVYSFTVSPVAASVNSISTATVVGDSMHEVDVSLTAPQSGYTWMAQADQPWVTFVSASGTGSGVLRVLMNATTTGTGLQTANVKVTITGPSNSSFTLPVAMQVDPLAVTVLTSDTASSVIYAASEYVYPNGGPDRAYLLELDSSNEVINRVVQVGSSVTDIAVDDADGRVYVNNWLSGNLLAIDQTTFQEVQGYGFPPFAGVGYSMYDIYRISAATPGRLVYEPEDQWVYMGLYNTVSGTTVATSFVRAGGGRCDPTGQYYFHGDSDDSDSELHKYNLTGDQFTEVVNTGSYGYGYAGYGGRSVVVTGDGKHVFWAGFLFDNNLSTLWDIGDEIESASPDGQYAVSTTQVYDTTLKKSILSLPVTASVSAFNGTTNRLVFQNGAQLQWVDFSGGSPLKAPALAIQQSNATSVALAWTDSSIAGGYTVQDLPEGETQWQTVATGLASSSTSYTVSGLTPSQAYGFRVSADSTGFASVFSNVVQATLPGAVLPTAVTGTAAATSAYTATLSGTVNPNGLATTAYFQIGFSTDYYASTNPVVVGSGTTPVAVTANLSLSTNDVEYHYRMVAVGTDGTTYGADETWVQGEPPPSVALLPAIVETDSSVTFLANVNPNGNATSAWFEYGTDPNNLTYSTPQTAVGSGDQSQSLAATATGLTPGATYYYVVYAGNSDSSATSNPMSVTLPGGVISPGTPGLAPELIAFTTPGEPCTINVTGTQAGEFVAFVGIPSEGTASILSNGEVLYQPGKRFKGQDIFAYVVEDAAGDTAAGIVFVENAYRSAAGVYNTVVGASDSTYGESGLITLAVDRNGTVTGNLRRLGQTYRFATKLNNQSASIRIPAGKEPITVGLSLDPLNQAVGGTVTSSSWSASYRAARTPFSPANPAPEAGSYTMMVQTSGSATGVAAAHVAASGLTTVAGWTPDGAPFTMSAYIDGNNEFPLYVSEAHPGRSELHGTTQFTNDSKVYGFNGTLGLSTSGSGAGNLLSAATSAYHPPGPGALMLGLEPGTGNGVLSFGNANGMEETLPATLGAAALSSTSRQLSDLKLDVVSGLFSGRLSLGGSAEAVFHGAAIQPDVIGYGQLVQGGQTGWVTLAGAPGSGGGSLSGGSGGVIYITSGSGSSSGDSGGILDIGSGSEGGGVVITLDEKKPSTP